MSSKKKDLEIICNLQWKDKLANGDKANMIGMYDVPATTLSWETFKSYLLKNSGAVDDVKVSYITDSNREFPIDSQRDFQIALYAFRRKARLGEIVNLKLERTGQEPVKVNRHSNDVETQFDNNEALSLASTCCNGDSPPEWFVLFMNQFKKEVKEEVTNTVSALVTNLKPHAPPQPACYHSRKSKPDNSKRMRKLQPHVADPSHETKDLLKSLKLEGKLERKLEKLEHKSKKIREKKIALFAKSSDSEAGQSSSKSHSRKDETDNDVFKMDALPVISQKNIPHMLGGEIYLHQWQVMNTGRLPWTNETTLNFTWGSKALKPLDTIIHVPDLNPNETTTLSVRLEIPMQSGQYECYWHFHHNGRRFGHWLGCQVIVDPFDLKGNKSVLETSFPSPFEQSVENHIPVDYTVMYSELKGVENCEREENVQSPPDRTYNSLIRNISRQLEDIKLQDPTDTNCSSDSDNQSIVSLNEINSTRGMPEEFVMVPIPDCFKVDNVSSNESSVNLLDLNDTDSPKTKEIVPLVNIQERNDGNCDDNNNSGKTNQNCQVAAPSDDILSNCSQRSDIVLVSLNEDFETGGDEYAYVLVEGQKSPVPVPKKIIKSEYLENCEKNTKTPGGNISRASSSGSSVEIVNKSDVLNFGLSPQKEEVIDEQARESTDLPSHCSTAGTCFSEGNSSLQRSSRVFVFPEDCPGYELLENANVTSTLFNNRETDLQEPTRGPSAHDPEIHVQEPTRGPSAPAARSTHPLNLTTHDRNPFSDHLSHVPNYQQTLPENRQAPEYVPIYPTPETAEAAFAPTTESFVSATEFNNESFTIPPEPVSASSPHTSTSSSGERRPDVVHILPETLVNGAVNVASSAINTARSVINMIRPQEIPPSNDVFQQPGTWINGRWVSANQETLREANLQALAEMGFWNRDLNATLLARFNDDLSRVVAELVQ